MVTSALRSLWAEPRPTNAPDRGPRDWALIAVLICWSVAEAVLTETPQPKVEPTPVTRVEPKLDTPVAPRPEFEPIPPEVVAHTSPQITSPDLQPGNGPHPSKDIPPATR